MRDCAVKVPPEFDGKVDGGLDGPEMGVSEAASPVPTIVGAINACGVPAFEIASCGLVASKPPVSSISLGWHFALSNTHSAHLFGPTLKEKQGRSGARAR